MKKGGRPLKKYKIQRKPGEGSRSAFYVSCVRIKEKKKRVVLKKKVPDFSDKGSGKSRGKEQGKRFPPY